MTTPNHGRQALVEAAIRSIATEGAARTHPKDLTEGLGLSKSLVNFHFGNRDGLMAEAIATSHERFVDLLWSAAMSAGEDPVARLSAWIDELLDWTAANPGLAAVIAYPDKASSLQGRFDDAAQARIEAAEARNLANLRTLVTAARAARRPGVDDETVGDITNVVAWLVLGASVWVSGDHIWPSTPDTDPRTTTTRQHLHDYVLQALAY